MLYLGHMRLHIPDCTQGHTHAALPQYIKVQPHKRGSTLHVYAAYISTCEKAIRRVQIL